MTDVGAAGAEALVRDFLAAMEARDLERARSFLAEGFVMHFPGGPAMTTLEELIAWAAPRYSGVRKTYEGVDVMPGAGETIVYCFGTLSGAWPDGESFQGIRFIDRFTVAGNRILDQRVWNDLAEARVLSVQYDPKGL
jgi:hypothetical protein